MPATQKPMAATRNIIYHFWVESSWVKESSASSPGKQQQDVRRIVRLYSFSMDIKRFLHFLHNSKYISYNIVHMPQADAPRLAAVLIVWGVRRPNLCVCSTIIGIWSKCVKPPPKTNRSDRIVVPLGVFFNNIKRLKTKEINRTALKTTTTTTIINTHIVAVVARRSRRPSRGLCYRNKVAKWLIKAHAEVCLCASQRNWKKNCRY